MVISEGQDRPGGSVRALYDGSVAGAGDRAAFARSSSPEGAKNGAGNITATPPRPPLATSLSLAARDGRLRLTERGRKTAQYTYSSSSASRNRK